ncbi:PREDICTED: LOB domain-containing protein 21 [Tarenaya hassleriana]|uniref:LOB domain-containing protein 21 n=1 Tax=Tarenaya hassleriana TaxID=28532 RepID=UPI00053C6CB9|nr:PREDICTED: LOB domain-containing protein 21 [Tarenaya hassleriana]
MRGHEPRSSSSCAACKLLKRRCVPSCIFAPYFRSSDPKTFAKVHKVFGASNVSKLLVEIPEDQRQETVNSLAYEAEVRLKDPVYGCIGAIASLQRKMLELQHDLAIARSRLARATQVSVSDDPAASLAGVLDIVPGYSELMLLDGFTFDCSLYDLGQSPFV